jgi:hypothetical protein
MNLFYKKCRNRSRIILFHKISATPTRPSQILASLGCRDPGPPSFDSYRAQKIKEVNMKCLPLLFYCAPGRNRTYDPPLKRRVLYHLSYERACDIFNTIRKEIQVTFAPTKFGWSRCHTLA